MSMYTILMLENRTSGIPKRNALPAHAQLSDIERAFSQYEL